MQYYVPNKRYSSWKRCSDSEIPTHPKRSFCAAPLPQPPPNTAQRQSAFRKQVHNCLAMFRYAPVSANKAQHLLYAKHIAKGLLSKDMQTYPSDMSSLS